ncbi:putative dehydrogenase [Fusobacterium sp. PH5-44]|uniref:Gfo/Idh/MocA family protein n=2 Tax=unclassified Fusobacterium TaxID=2648384 RepID=UPI003D201F00
MVGKFGGMLNKTFENGDPIEVYDNAICILKMKSGVIGTGTFSWTYYGKEDNSTTLYMENGIIRIYDDPKYQIIIVDKNGKEEKLEVEAIQTNDNQTSTGVIDKFVDAIINNKKSEITAEDGAISIKVVKSIMKSIDDKKEIEIL